MSERQSPDLRVLAGAKRLDEHFEGRSWMERIDPDTLMVADRASGTFVRMAEQVERLAARLDALDRALREE